MAETMAKHGWPSEHIVERFFSHDMSCLFMFIRTSNGNNPGASKPNESRTQKTVKEPFLLFRTVPSKPRLAVARIIIKWANGPQKKGVTTSYS